MKLVPPSDRPREKLVRAGVASLGDNELVAILLGSGVASRNALAVANELLETAGGIAALTHVGIDELVRVPGVGLPRAARVVAAVELGRRAVSATGSERPCLDTPEAIGHYLLTRHGGTLQERFGAVLLDGKMRLIRVDTLSIGTADASLAHPRELFRAATLAAASAVVIFHSHPSGDPSPSVDDLHLTSRFVMAGELMGIEVIDHIILGAGQFYSFRKERHI